MHEFESVAGIDLSLSETAIAIRTKHEDGSISHASFAIRERDQDFIRRADRISLDVLSTLIRHAPKPCLLVIESPALHSKGSAVYQIFGLNAIVRHTLHRAGMNWVEISPSSLKKFCTGKGNSPKQTIMLETYKRFGYSPTNDNDADAFVLSEIGCALIGWRQPTNKAQKEVINSILKNGWPHKE